MEFEEFDKLVEAKDFEKLEALKDKIEQGSYFRIICPRCDDSTNHVTMPDPDTWKCAVCQRHKGSLRALDHCPICQRSYSYAKGENCACSKRGPFSSLKITVDPRIQKKRDEARKSMRSDGSSIIEKKLRDFERQKFERAKNIENSLAELNQNIKKLIDMQEKKIVQ